MDRAAEFVVQRIHQRWYTITVRTARWSAARVHFECCSLHRKCATTGSQSTGSEFVSQKPRKSATRFWFRNVNDGLQGRVAPAERNDRSSGVSGAVFSEIVERVRTSCSSLQLPGRATATRIDSLCGVTAWRSAFYAYLSWPLYPRLRRRSMQGPSHRVSI